MAVIHLLAVSSVRRMLVVLHSMTSPRLAIVLCISRIRHSKPRASAGWPSRMEMPSGRAAILRLKQAREVLLAPVVEMWSRLLVGVTE